MAKKTPEKKAKATKVSTTNPRNTAGTKPSVKSGTLPTLPGDLAALADVPWQALPVFAGDILRVPDLIRAENVMNADSVAELAATLLNGGLTEASVWAASFLWTRVAQSGAERDVSPLVYLLVDMALGSDIDFLRTGFDWASPAIHREFGRLERALMEQLRASSAPVTLAESSIAANRTAAAYVSAFSGLADSTSRLEQLARDDDAGVTATALLGLAVRPDARVGEAGDAKKGDLQAGALGIASALEGTADPDLLLRGVSAGLRPRGEFPWNRGAIWMLCALELLRLPDQAGGLVEALFPLLGKAQDADSRLDQGAVLELLHEVLFANFKGRFKSAVVAAELSDSQRSGLQRLKSLGVGGLKAFGLPATPQGFDLLLDATGPLSTELSVKGQPAQPLWKWLEAMAAKSITQAELLEGLQAGVDPKLAHQALCDAFRLGPGVVPVPWPALCAGVAQWVGANGKAEAETLLAELEGLKLTWNRQTMDLALIPLASAGLTTAQRAFADNVAGQYPHMISAELRALYQQG